MAKQRLVNTRFWVDDYISNLDPIEKLLFLYFLTNPSTDISGVYEVPLKTVATDTGIEVETVKRIIRRFSRDRRIYYVNGWVGIKNFAKHQTTNPSVLAGIKNGLNKAPNEILDRLSQTVPNESHLNLNTNTNLNLNLNTNEQSSAYGEFQKVKLSPKDYKKLQDSLGEKNTNILIAELDTYIASKGKRYSNHYATLLNWARRKMVEHNSKGKGII